jgi:hypothetical protein
MAWSGSAITTATNVVTPRVKRFAALACLAFGPKCLVCGLAYAGLFGLGGAELCGGAPSAWPRVLSVAAAATGGFFLLNPCRRFVVFRG